jgi:hypothetical protein
MARNLVIVGLMLGALLGSLGNHGARSAGGSAEQAARAAEWHSAAASCDAEPAALHDPVSCIVGDP